MGLPEDAVKVLEKYVDSALELIDTFDKAIEKLREAEDECIRIVRRKECGDERGCYLPVDWFLVDYERVYGTLLGKVHDELAGKLPKDCAEVFLDFLHYLVQVAATAYPEVQYEVLRKVDELVTLAPKVVEKCRVDPYSAGIILDRVYDIQYAASARYMAKVKSLAKELLRKLPQLMR